jgi:hypothetical protein
MNTHLYSCWTQVHRPAAVGLLVVLVGCAAFVPLAAQTPSASSADVAVARFLVDIDGLESDDDPGEAGLWTRTRFQSSEGEADPPPHDPAGAAPRGRMIAGGRIPQVFVHPLGIEPIGAVDYTIL